MPKTKKTPPRFTKAQLEEAAKLELFIRHVRNLAELGSHAIRAEGVDATRSLELLMGEDYNKIYKTKEWKRI